MNTKLYNYFNRHEFKQFIGLLKQKYISYGTCTGSINIIPKSIEEAFMLSSFLGLNLKMNKKASIKISYIQSKLDDSIFDGTMVDDLVKLFYPDIKTNREIRDEFDSYVVMNLDKYKDMYLNSNIGNLFKYEDELRHLIKYENDLLSVVLVSLNNLPIFSDGILSLSIFASNTVGDPHFYDLDTHASNVLIKFICLLNDIEYKNDRKSKISVLSSVGLYIDAVSNYVITYNLYGNDMLDVFKSNLMPINLNLYNIDKMDNIWCVNNKLLVVENPSFISMVVGKRLPYSVVVTSGNSNLVVYKLMDKLKNCDIYFNGDFDPEGLMIAFRFKSAYPNTKFIGYNSKYYYNGISSNALSSSRLKKIDNVGYEELNVIKDLLIKEMRASYQETNYNLLIEDINKEIYN